MALQITKGHAWESGLFEYFLVYVVELVELVRRFGFWIKKHIGRGRFRYPLQEMSSFVIERQQTLSSEDVLVADMKIGPRQGDQFTLPQAA